MADREFDDINVLINEIKGEIVEVLAQEVFEKIKEVELEHIETDVWNAYLERQYEWRGSGGINDPDNLEREIDISGDEIELKVINNTLPVRDDGMLDEIIEYGFGMKNKPYSKPRPFIKNTQQEIEDSKIVEKILKEQLDYIE